jgi:tetratricopeptide (TPR) repeat protein
MNNELKRSIRSSSFFSYNLTCLFTVPMLILVLSFSLTGCGTNKVQLREEAKIHYDLGSVYFREGKAVPALKELMQAVEKDPKNAAYRNLLGLAYYSKKLFTEAEEEYLEAIKLDPKLSGAHINLGVVYLRQSLWDKAIKEFDSGLSNVLYATPEIAYTNMGWAYYNKGDYETAIRAFNRAIESNPRYVSAYYNQGLAYLNMDKNRKAVESFTKAIEIFPDFINAHYYLGLTYLTSEDEEQARKSFQKVIDLPSEGDLRRSSIEHLEQLKLGE